MEEVLNFRGIKVKTSKYLPDGVIVMMNEKEVLEAWLIERDPVKALERASQHIVMIINIRDDEVEAPSNG